MVDDRQCDLRDATEFGDLPSVGHWSRLIAEGAGKLHELGGRATSVKHGAVRGQSLWTVAFARFDMKEFSARKVL